MSNPLHVDMLSNLLPLNPLHAHVHSNFLMIVVILWVVLKKKTGMGDHLISICLNFYL
jgi:hypothetical protein